METAYEILTQLLKGFRESIPGVEFMEAADGRARAPSPFKARVTGAVAKEVIQGNEWSARLAFQVLLPGRGVLGGAGSVIGAMAEYVKESQPLFTGMERGGAAADKTGGLVAESCVFSFFKPGSSGGKKTAYPVEIDGKTYRAAGWKVSQSAPGGGLTAIGESEPFYYRSRREFTIELQGLCVESPEKLEGFSLRLGDQKVMYTGCRWRSLSAAGTGVLAAGGRTAVEGE